MDILTKPLIEWAMLDSITFLAIVGIITCLFWGVEEIRKRRNR